MQSYKTYLKGRDQKQIQKEQKRDQSSLAALEQKMISEEKTYQQNLQHKSSQVIKQDIQRDVATSVKHAPGAVRCASE